MNSTIPRTIRHWSVRVNAAWYQYDCGSVPQFSMQSVRSPNAEASCPSLIASSGHSQIADGAVEAEQGEVLVVDGVVEVVQRLDAAGLGVEDFGVGAQLLSVSVGDDVDVLLGLDDGQLGDRDAASGLEEVEPSGADLKRDVGGGVGPTLQRGAFLLLDRRGPAPGGTAVGDRPVRVERRRSDPLGDQVVRSPGRRKPSRNRPGA